MIVAALLFLLAVLSVQQLTSLPNVYVLAACGVLGLLLASFRFWRSALFVFAFLWACGFAMLRLNDRLTPELEGVELPITGQIISLPDVEDRRISFDFAPDNQQLPSKIRLSCYETQQVFKVGQRWAFNVKLKRPHGSLNPNGFDYEKLLLTQGIGAVGYVRPEPKPQFLDQGAWSIQVWRQRIADELAKYTDGENLALIKALTIGDGSAISQQDWEVFRKTGTTHLIVISGSHVGLIAGLVYFLILKSWAWTGVLRYSPPKVAAISALILGVFYSALAGFSTPTQRAAVMLTVAMLAILYQRHTRPLQTLAAAVIAVLLYDPFAVLSAGFWLSFIAVALIIYSVSGRLGKINIVWETLKLNGVMSLGLAPLTLLFFQQVTLISPVANLIAVPVISFIIVPLSLLAVIFLGFAPVLADALLWISEQSLQLLMRFLTASAAFPLATYNHATPSLWAIMSASVGVLLLLAPRGSPARFLGLFLLLPLIFNKPQRPAQGELSLTLLDVGQGLAIAVQTAEHDLIYDTGAKFSDTSDQGKNVVLPFLRQQGVNQLDMLMISHGDNDHIGGADSILKNISVKKLLTSAPKQLANYPLELCRAGQSWQWDGIEFNILSPDNSIQSDNNNSCVLHIKTQNGNILLTGDIEAEAEHHLVQLYGNTLHAKILIAPHHGSHTSSTEPFLNALKPDTILISSGYRNMFGHPHPEVISRYQHQHITYFNSADTGAISLYLKNGKWEIEKTRELDSRYWNFKP